MEESWRTIATTGCRGNGNLCHLARRQGCAKLGQSGQGQLVLGIAGQGLRGQAVPAPFTKAVELELDAALPWVWPAPFRLVMSPFSGKRWRMNGTKRSDRSRSAGNGVKRFESAVITSTSPEKGEHSWHSPQRKT